MHRVNHGLPFVDTFCFNVYSGFMYTPPGGRKAGPNIDALSKVLETPFGAVWERHIRSENLISFILECHTPSEYVLCDHKMTLPQASKWRFLTSTASTSLRKVKDTSAISREYDAARHGATHGLLFC